MKVLSLAIIGLAVGGAQFPGPAPELPVLYTYGTWVLLLGVAHHLDRRISALVTRVAVIEAAGSAGGDEAT